MMPIQHRRMGVTLLLLRLIKTVQLDNFTIYSIEYECYTSLCWRAQIHFLEAHLEQEQQFSNFDTIEDVQRAMFAQSYIADRSLATAVFLALKRRKPLLLEGEPGVGKTEIAKVLAAALDTQLIRLQCYEGIDIRSEEHTSELRSQSNLVCRLLLEKKKKINMPIYIVNILISESSLTHSFKHYI